MRSLHTYTRWTESDDAGVLLADLLGTRHDIAARPASGHVLFDGQEMAPDEARMYGVRLIEAASLADGPRAIRSRPAEVPNGS
jgi:hypothetical protein